MPYTGLVPSERSSGDVERRGLISRTGDRHLRRVLVEAAWHYRHHAGAELILRRRRQGQNPVVVAIAVKAQHRLGRKFRRLVEKKHINKAVVAVARELTGFIWDALTTVADQKDVSHSMPGEAARQEDPRLKYAAGTLPNPRH